MDNSVILVTPDITYRTKTKTKITKTQNRKLVKLNHKYELETTMTL